MEYILCNVSLWSEHVLYIAIKFKISMNEIYQSYTPQTQTCCSLIQFCLCKQFQSFRPTIRKRRALMGKNLFADSPELHAKFCISKKKLCLVPRTTIHWKVCKFAQRQVLPRLADFFLAKYQEKRCILASWMIILQCIKFEKSFRETRHWSSHFSSHIGSHLLCTSIDL